jgi:hypothetical protein
MNIIELVKQTVFEFPQISALSGGVNVDFTKTVLVTVGYIPRVIRRSKKISWGTRIDNTTSYYMQFLRVLMTIKD